MFYWTRAMVSGAFATNAKEPYAFMNCPSCVVALSTVRCDVSRFPTPRVALQGNSAWKFEVCGATLTMWSSHPLPKHIVMVAYNLSICERKLHCEISTILQPLLTLVLITIQNLG